MSAQHRYDRGTKGCAARAVQQESSQNRHFLSLSFFIESRRPFARTIDSRLAHRPEAWPSKTLHYTNPWFSFDVTPTHGVPSVDNQRSGHPRMKRRIGPTIKREAANRCQAATDIPHCSKPGQWPSNVLPFVSLDRIFPQTHSLHLGFHFALTRMGSPRTVIARTFYHQWPLCHSLLGMATSQTSQGLVTTCARGIRGDPRERRREELSRLWEASRSGTEFMYR